MNIPKKSYFYKTTEELKKIQDEYLDNQSLTYRQYELRPSWVADMDLALLDRQIAHRECYDIARREVVKLYELNKILFKALQEYEHRDSSCNCPACSSIKKAKELEGE